MPRSPRLIGLLAIAAAAPSTTSLSWVRLPGAESCVAAPELAAEVEERLGRPVFRPPAEAELAVEGRVEPAAAPNRWRAVLRLADHDGASLGERVVESRAEGCEELGHAVAVTLALMIDPVTTPEAPVPEAPTEVERWHLDLHATLDVGYGLVPGVTVGGSATALVTPPRFVPLEVTGELVPFARDATGTVDLTRAVGGVGVCPLDLQRGWGELRGCAAVLGGALVAVRGGEALDGAERLLVEGRGQGRASLRVWGPLRVDVGVQGVVPFRRIVLVSDGGVEVWTAPPVAGLFDLGVGARF